MGHVQHIHDDRKTWCGETISTTEFHFKNLDQIILNGLHPTGIPACEACVTEIKTVLTKSLRSDDDQNEKTGEQPPSTEN